MSIYDKVKAAFEAAKISGSTEAIYLSILLGDMDEAIKNGDTPELIFDNNKLNAKKLLESSMKYQDGFYYDQAMLIIRILNGLEA